MIYSHISHSVCVPFCSFSLLCSDTRVFCWFDCIYLCLSSLSQWILTDSCCEESHEAFTDMLNLILSLIVMWFWTGGERITGFNIKLQTRLLSHLLSASFFLCTWNNYSFTNCMNANYSTEINSILLRIGRPLQIFRVRDYKQNLLFHALARSEILVCFASRTCLLSD